MKRFIAVLSGLLVMPAFAEVAPIYFDEVVEYTDDFLGDELVAVEEVVADAAPAKPVIPAITSPRAGVNTGRAATRIVPTATGQNVVSRSAAAQRPISSRTTATTTSARTPTTTTQSRGAAQSSNQSVTARRNTSAPVNAARAASDIIQTDTVNHTLYSPVRVSARPTSVAASTRAPTIRMASMTSSMDTAPVATGPTIDELAQMTDFCKAQYTQCMDNFCAVLDDNQGRCSCSANIKNYTKTEDALKKATEELQEVAQKIQYIGLTKDEIETLFTQTEAELAMQGRTDNTQLKNDLDRVKNLIINVKSGNATAGDVGLNLDLSGLLDFSFSDIGFDLGTLFGGDSSSNSISNQRGVELHKTATARCKSAVIDGCRAQGVDPAIMTNSYDLEIDKQCIAYERNLTDANTQMSNTVRNAKSVLQKARLVVAQQKNSYDLRGCVNALDSCMQDEFVCGSDYDNCLDPTGKYIVNGDVVIGSEPGVPGGGLLPTSSAITSGLYSTWNYSTTENAWGRGNVSNFIAALIGRSTSVSVDMVGFLEQKIGYSADGKNHGMCISVLNRCQDVTYIKGVYNKSNKAVEGYLHRTLVQIKAAQDEILSSYSENCISDVASCLASNGYSDSAYAAIKNSAKRACDAHIRTCASVTGAGEEGVISAAVGEMVGQFNVTYDLRGKATWKTGFNPVLYYDTNFIYILPGATDLDLGTCTFVGWSESADGSTPPVSNIPSGATNNKSFYLQTSGC